MLKAEGLRVVLVNSNPATIMTDPEIADATYVEPITPEFVEKIIAKERPGALLPTLGSQTALNTAISLHGNGVLEKYGVELIGANVEAINKGEGPRPVQGRRGGGVRKKIGHGESARSYICHSMDDVLGASRSSAATRSSSAPPSPWAAPARLRPRRGGAAPHRRRGLTLSPTTEVLLEESILSWKGVRAGADARQERQRRGRLLHRELRPHGRPHRRPRSPSRPR